MGERIRFLADCMLGRLARCLRILGYDTEYAGSIDDRRIVAWARYEGRVLLSRDGDLIRRAGPLGCPVPDERVDRQIEYVVKTFSLSGRNRFTRCPKCNGVLEFISRDKARPEVPLYVYQGFSEFKQCSKCHQIYWKGTHWERMNDRFFGDKGWCGPF